MTDCNIKIFEDINSCEFKNFIFSTTIGRLTKDSEECSRYGTFCTSKQISLEINNIAKMEGTKVLAVFYKNTMLGYCIFTETEKEPLFKEVHEKIIFKDRDMFYKKPIIHYIYVKLSFQRKGLMRMMLDHLGFETGELVYCSYYSNNIRHLPYRFMPQRLLRNRAVPIEVRSSK